MANPETTRGLSGREWLYVLGFGLQACILITTVGVTFGVLRTTLNQTVFDISGIRQAVEKEIDSRNHSDQVLMDRILNTENERSKLMDEQKLILDNQLLTLRQIDMILRKSGI